MPLALILFQCATSAFPALTADPGMLSLSVMKPSLTCKYRSSNFRSSGVSTYFKFGGNPDNMAYYSATVLLPRELPGNATLGYSRRCSWLCLCTVDIPMYLELLPKK
jgi:hypothetical protein